MRTEMDRPCPVCECAPMKQPESSLIVNRMETHEIT